MPETSGRLRFGHVVIRECLYDEIPRALRRQLHRTALQVLESLYGGDIEQHVSQLAHHAYDGAGDAGELLDDEARRAYRARIAELRAAIDEAQTAGAAYRAGALQEELDFITRELSRGLGIGGRARRAGSVAERARVNVTRAVTKTA